MTTHEEKEFIQGLFRCITPITVQYDQQVQTIQHSQQALAKKLDVLTTDMEKMIKESENSYETKGHLARIVSTRKKIVAIYNNLGVVEERLNKIQKAITAKQPNLHQQFDTFGIPLAEVMKRSRETEKVPKHMVKIAQRIREIGLEREGIFRLSALANDVKEIQQRYNEGEDIDVSQIKNNILLAQVFKQYLRDLPTPLCTEELYEQFLATSVVSSNTEKLQKYSDLLKKIPSENYELMKLSFELAFDTSKLVDKNKMGPHNLAVVFGMNIFANKAHDGMKAMKDNPAIIKVAQWMIEHFQSLFNGAPLEEVVIKEEKIEEQIPAEEIMEALKEDLLEEDPNASHLRKKSKLEIDSEAIFGETETPKPTKDEPEQEPEPITYDITENM
jgi:hypothetical protein